jgi:DNA-binding transcriptional MerR regulator
MAGKRTLTLDIKKRLTISEVSTIIGVSCKTLTRLEKSGKTPKAKRDWRGWRVYDEGDLLKIKNFFETVFEVE